MQRDGYRAGRLSDERAHASGAPRWVWARRDGRVGERARRAERYAARERHVRVPTSSSRMATRSGNGSSSSALRIVRSALDGRAALLVKAPGWQWNPHDASWEEGYARLAAFAARQATLAFRRDYVEDDGYRLGRWVVSSACFHGWSAFDDREPPPRGPSRLDWDPHAVDWDRATPICELRRREGHARVPQAESKTVFRSEVGHRAARHIPFRSARRERTARLEALLGWVWNTRRPPQVPPILQPSPDSPRPAESSDGRAPRPKTIWDVFGDARNADPSGSRLSDSRRSKRRSTPRSRKRSTATARRAEAHALQRQARSGAGSEPDPGRGHRRARPAGEAPQRPRPRQDR